MKRISFKEKLSLVIFGIFLSVILLEAGLRIAGSIVFFLQERHNHVSFNQNEYPILCLGESTTALGGEDSYPSELEALLNAQEKTKRITVINKGIISTTSNYILAHVEQNLDIYKPQMVIVMMGINDRAYLQDLNKVLWWEDFKLFFKDFRVYKLAHLLYGHITHRIKEIKAPAQAADLSQESDDNYQVVEDFLKHIVTANFDQFSAHMSASVQYEKNQQIPQALQEKESASQSLLKAASACVELSKRFRQEGLLLEAQKILTQATIFAPKSTDVFQEWGELYLAQKNTAQALQAFQTAFVLDPKNSSVLLGLAHAYYQEHNDNAYIVYTKYLQSKPHDYWGFIEIAQWLKENKHDELALVYLNHAIEIEPLFDQAYTDLGQILDEMGQYQKEESFYLKEIALHSQSFRLYQALAQFYQKQGKEELAKEYFQKAAGRQMPEYCPATLVNYSLLLDKILSRHIKVIVMQYPLREIGILKNYLGQRHDVIYVENRQNFKQALSNGGYSQYFKDNFAYDFGHCTREGNGLIARQLTEVILKNE